MFLIEGDGKAILYTGDIRGMYCCTQIVALAEQEQRNRGGLIALCGTQF